MGNALCSAAQGVDGEGILRGDGAIRGAAGDAFSGLCRTAVPWWSQGGDGRRLCLVGRVLLWRVSARKLPTQVHQQPVEPAVAGCWGCAGRRGRP